MKNEGHRRTKVTPGITGAEPGQGQAMKDPGNSPRQARRLFESLSPNSWAALTLLIIGITYYLLIPYQVDKPMLVFGQALMDMKPTLFPTIAGIGLTVTSALALVQSLRNREKNQFKSMTRTVLMQLCVILIVLYIFALAFEPVGFLISGVLVTTTLSLFLGNRDPLSLAILAVGVPGAVYFVFTKLLYIALPEGLLY